jgi:hypothetical protein
VQETTPTTITSADIPPTKPAAPPKSKSWVLIIVIVVVLLICCAVTAVLALVFLPVLRGEVLPDIDTKPTTTPTETSVSPTASVTPSGQASAPSGFSWVTCSNLESKFLLPDGWYKREENSTQSNNTHSCFITKEEIIGTNGQFKVGLSVNKITKVRSQTNESATSYAYRLMNNAERTYETVEPIQTIRGGGGLTGYGRFVATSKTAYPLRQYILAIGNNSADLLYIISFKAPSADWNEAWNQYGETIMENLGLSAE